MACSMANRTGSGLHVSDLLEILRIDRLTQVVKKLKIWKFFMHYWKSYGINKKKIYFCFFFNYLKTENRKNSLKKYTNVLLDGRCSSIFWKNFYSKFNNKKKKCFSRTNWFFEKMPSLKNLKKCIVLAPSITYE